MQALSRARKLGYATLVFAVFLVLLEGALTALPAVLSRAGAVGGEGAGLIVCLGDSVTFGHGLRPDAAWPARLHQRVAGRTPDVRVINRGRGGLSLGALRPERALGEPELRDGLVLVMLGHNDFLGWTGEQKNPFGNAAEPASSSPGWSPRLLRVGAWMLYLLDHEPPEDKLGPQTEPMVRQRLADLDRVVRARHGRLVVLTYPVPGAPPASMPEDRASAVSASRDAQIAGNQILRDATRAQSLPLIDLERALPIPEVWDAAWFLDDIHLTAAGSDAVAAAVDQHLVLWQLGASP